MIFLARLIRKYVVWYWVIADSKQHHKTITIDQRSRYWTNYVKDHYTFLCEEYGIGWYTITDIKKRESLCNYKRKMVEMGAGRSVKVMKLFKDEELKIALYQLF